MYRCPHCDTPASEELDDGRAFCEPCRLVFTPQQPPRLLDPGHRERKDTT